MHPTLVIGAGSSTSASSGKRLREVGPASLVDSDWASVSEVPRVELPRRIKKDARQRPVGERPYRLGGKCPNPYAHAGILTLAGGSILTTPSHLTRQRHSRGFDRETKISTWRTCDRRRGLAALTSGRAAPPLVRATSRSLAQSFTSSDLVGKFSPSFSDN